MTTKVRHVSRVAANTLGGSTSPYLRQHADNPVHWREWTPEALTEAASRDVPILLSIGYAACHWCHVMAHESFEDADVAAVLNDGFVCIKVDREERPDLDAVYMNATVALTGQGGWPMTCFLTPDGRPFFCGTYYPKLGFLQLLDAVAETWRDRRDEVERASDQIATELRSMSAGLPGGGAPVGPELCDHAVAAVLHDEDETYGGFGGAPKFPPSALLEGLLRHHERTGSVPALTAVRRTCAAMARGGIYDQLAGGFARYSVDPHWVVPHFEKMLYDNALLLRAYAHLARRTGDPLARRVAGETAAFLRSDLGAGGMFTSSLDADAGGREGLTYVWTPAELLSVLGDDDGAWAASLFGVTAGGTFEHGASVLQLHHDPDDAARFASVRTTLLAARALRPQPARDDKVVTAWNGLAITALAEASVALGQPELLSAAVDCARRLLDLHVVDGRLRRASLGGRVGESAAILEDHAALATALLTLYQLTGFGLSEAVELLDVALDHFADPDQPGRWFDTADDAERLMVRPADPIDGATPSGASLITEALQAAGYLTGSARYLDAAQATLSSATPILARAARSGGHWLAVAEAQVLGPIQIAVAGDPASPLLAAARRLAPGGALVIGGAVDSSPLLAGRDRVDGADAAYVCRGTVCDLPVTTGADLAVSLGGDPADGGSGAV
ncbi:thioredoxin domain-containing protein [Mycolicibacterium porcinum]